jgi:hypothetical protein
MVGISIPRDVILAVVTRSHYRYGIAYKNAQAPHAVFLNQNSRDKMLAVQRMTCVSFDITTDLHMNQDLLPYSQ